MNLNDIVEKYPDVLPYIQNMPSNISYVIKTYAPGQIIHQKHFKLDYFGIVCAGEHRVINEFENGNIFMIEKNEPVDFIGEVTILAGMAETSVTIESITECVVIIISRNDFENWIQQDINFLRLVSQKVAYKLYRSSFNRGAKLFYPPTFLLLDYLLKHAKSEKISIHKNMHLNKTREQLHEELGITVKTINRTIKKLVEDQLISLKKGKIQMDYAQYKRAKNTITHYIK